MTDEQALIDLINANAGQGDRLAEYVYADWLDDRGDPRGEGWRVLLEMGKRPDFRSEAISSWGNWTWWKPDDRIKKYSIHSQLGFNVKSSDWFGWFQDYFDAMDAAAIAWVRENRDPEFLMEAETVD